MSCPQALESNSRPYKLMDKLEIQSRMWMYKYPFHDHCTIEELVPKFQHNPNYAQKNFRAIFHYQSTLQRTKTQPEKSFSG